MKHYKLEDLHIGMKVYADELYNIEGVYILLTNPKVVMTEEGTRTQATIKKISKKKIYITQSGDTLYYRRKGYSEIYGD